MSRRGAEGMERRKGEGGSGVGQDGMERRREEERVE